MKDAEYYWKRAKICWIIAGIFFVIALICRILLLAIELFGH